MCARTTNFTKNRYFFALLRRTDWTRSLPAFTDHSRTFHVKDSYRLRLSPTRQYTINKSSPNEAPHTSMQAQSQQLHPGPCKPGGDDIAEITIAFARLKTSLGFLELPAGT